jgi:hypothetical protein
MKEGERYIDRNKKREENRITKLRMQIFLCSTQINK